MLGILHVTKGVAWVWDLNREEDGFLQEGTYLMVVGDEGGQDVEVSTGVGRYRVRKRDIAEARVQTTQ